MRDGRMRYIGGKTLLLDAILGAIRTCPGVRSVVDAFSGSGAVSVRLKEAGYAVTANDALHFCFCLARGTLGVSSSPTFSRLPVRDAIAHLNALTPDAAGFDISDCFVYNNYSPNDHCERMYFRNDNALKIDIIRMQIERWNRDGLLTEDEYFHLLAALLRAIPSVANITGTFGAYLKFWERRSLLPLVLRPHAVIPAREPIRCLCGDFSDVLAEEADLLYADPPYNSREYLPNYHILETVARWDAPAIRGVTGMREHAAEKSPFCGKRTVRAAFETLIRDCRAKWLLISYSTEGLLDAGELEEICREHAADGSLSVTRMDYQRYGSRLPGRGGRLEELLFLLRRHA